MASTWLIYQRIIFLVGPGMACQMIKMTAFYAWQSDTAPKFNRELIDKALRDAAKRLSEDSSLAVEIMTDSDTQGVPGTPPITETVLKKIDGSEIFVPDVTFVGRTEAGKLLPNPNVMMEFGYALRAKTHAAIMPIMNTSFGPPRKVAVRHGPSPPPNSVPCRTYGE